MPKKKLLLGAHISAAGGLYKSLERGASIGCTTMQIFTKSNRQWAAKELTVNEITKFKKAVKQHSIAPIVAHCSYLINIGSPNEQTAAKSILALKIELQRCQDLEIPYLVLHPGSHLKAGEDECLARIAKNLDCILNETPGNTMILLETMAGQGSAVCHIFEHIATIRKLSQNNKRIGVCFDTCHAFVAGYDLRTKNSYEKTWLTFDKIIGLQNLKVIHVNDSKKELGSRVDRHENIGDGKIGLEGFKLLFNDKRFFDIPKILETPKDDLNEDLINMQKIVTLLSDETKNELEISVAERIN